MDAQDSRRQGALIPWLVKEQDTIAHPCRRDRDLVLILQQHVELEPRGGPALVEWRVQPVPVLDRVKEVGKPSRLHPPLRDGPLPPGPSGGGKEAMTCSMELFDANPDPHHVVHR